MTTATTSEIEAYYARVRAALEGLAPEVRDDLLEDLPGHLAEVLAEGDGSLTDRLGEPEAYAEELRAAAGIEPGEGWAGRGGHAMLKQGVRRTAEMARAFDLRAGRLIGYGRLTDLFRAARPGWWILRGWIVAQFVCGTHNRSSWHGFIPSAGGNSLAGLVCTLVVIGASIWLGRRSLRFAVWPRRVMLGASTVVALWGAVVLAGNFGASSDGFNGSAGVQPYFDSADVTDVYVYDQNGKPVNNARLYDQDGNPIVTGDPYCANGSVAPGAGADGDAPVWTYPLCPASAGPFGTGPGPLPASPTAAGTAPASAAPSSPKPGSGHKPKASPGVSPTG